MPLNRISGWFPRRIAAPAASSSAFVVCPAVLQREVTEEQQATQRQIYEWAMEQAAAVVRPSILERWQADLLN